MDVKTDHRGSKWTSTHLFGLDAGEECPGIMRAHLPGRRWAPAGKGVSYELQAYPIMRGMGA